MRDSRPARSGTRNAMAPALHRPMRRSASLASLCSRIAVTRPWRVEQQPAVAGGVGRLEAERGDAGAGVERGHQPAQRGRLHQRRVGEQHDHVALVPLQRRPRRQQRVAGAGLRRLLEHLDARRDRARPRRAPPPCRAPPPAASRAAPAARAVASACASIERPAMACSTLGTLERMRTPLPAARTTIRRGWVVMSVVQATVGVAAAHVCPRLPRNLRAGTATRGAAEAGQCLADAQYATQCSRERRP